MVVLVLLVLGGRLDLLVVRVGLALLDWLVRQEWLGIRGIRGQRVRLVLWVRLVILEEMGVLDLRGQWV